MQQLRALEERLLNASGRGSGGSGGDEDLFDLLADDFVEFSSSGRVFSREDIIEAIRHAPAPDSTRRTLHDFRVMELGPDVALVTYQALSASRDANGARSDLFAARSGSARPVGLGRWCSTRAREPPPPAHCRRR
jgi:hypothetical protein